MLKVQRFTIFAQSVVNLNICFLYNRLTLKNKQKQKETDYYVTEASRLPGRDFAPTSHPVPVSCISHTPALLIQSGLGRYFPAAR